MTTLINNDVREVGVCALYLAAIEGYNRDDALEYIETGKQYKRKKYQANTTDEKIDMVKMKIRDGRAYAEIAEVFGLSSSNVVYNKLKRMQDKKDTKDMVAMRKAGLYYYEIAKFYGDITKQGVHYRITRFRKKNREVSS